MRKAQKREALELIASLHQAHEEIKEALRKKEYGPAQNMLGECQEFAVALGEMIERTEGEGHSTVAHIENYCETLFQVFQETGSGQVNEKKLYKILRKRLLAVENSVKNDISAKTEVVFFPYKASMWDSLESVYLAAKKDPDCDAYCVPIPYFDLNPDHSPGKMHYEGDAYPEEIEITDWQKYDLEERKPDVVYIHNPYDGCNLVTSVHPRFYASNLKKYTECLVYIPYYSTSGGMSEAQSLCPAYLYADHIVIQSPKFRAYFDQNLPDRKFLPLGSPKFDSVIEQCKNPPEPPAEWAAKMAGEGGRWKRVIFYNTSINGMLADTENFLRKIEYVFQCFEGRKDVCLLWRPHPLLETTFDSMRPQYRQGYEALKEVFLEKGLGILDTTPDIAGSVALSDAYIGDAGTSVTSLFGVVGKPMFILDKRILGRPGKDGWREVAKAGLEFQEQDRFTIIQGNKLYRSEPGKYDYRYECDLPDCRRGGEYSVVLETDGKLYACPGRRQDILVIGNQGVERKIELKQEAVNGKAFAGAWKYKRFLLLQPLYYPALVRYDTVTGECIYYREYIDVFTREKDGRRITGGAFLYRGCLYLASPVENRMWTLDIESGEIQVIEIPIRSRCGCVEFVEYQDALWMLPYTGRIVVRWNPQTGDVREYTGCPEKLTCIDLNSGLECEEMPFSTMAFYGGYVYLAPRQADRYLRLQIDTGQFERWEIPFEERAGRNVFFPWWKPEEQGGWLKIYSNAERRLYHINMKTGEWEEIEIKFDRKELEEHEAGFGACSETLPYACIENALNPLDRFLDGMTVGNPFDKEKQLAAYRELAANSDGSSGRKIYEYIKAQEK